MRKSLFIYTGFSIKINNNYYYIDTVVDHHINTKTNQLNILTVQKKKMF